LPGRLLHLLRGYLRAGTQFGEMSRSLSIFDRVPRQRAIRGDRGVECRQVPSK
jgi:hypothetical protein